MCLNWATPLGLGLAPQGATPLRVVKVKIVGWKIMTNLVRAKIPAAPKGPKSRKKPKRPVAVDYGAHPPMARRATLRRTSTR